MPTAVKQKQVHQPAANNGSILGRARPVKEVHSDYLAITVYGTNRVGKTTLACTFPKPLLLISFEPADCGGAESVTNVPGVDFLPLKTRGELLQLCDDVKSGSKYKTYVIDTGTSLQDKILCEILGLEKLPEQLGFGVVGMDRYVARAEQVKETLRAFMGVPGHRVILNQEKDHRPRSGEETNLTPKFVAGLQLSSFLSADLGGGNAGWLRDACPYVCRLYLADEEKEEVVPGQKMVQLVRTGKRERRLLLQLQTNFDAGFRVPGNITLPDYISNPTYDKLMKVIRGQKV